MEMYFTVDFICIGRFELWGTQRKRELQNKKFLPTVGLDHTNLPLTKLELHCVLRAPVREA